MKITKKEAGKLLMDFRIEKKVARLSFKELEKIREFADSLFTTHFPNIIQLFKI